MEFEYDFERLRIDLLRFFGESMMFNQMAMLNIVDVENADNEKLLHLAQSNGFDLDEYKVMGKSL